MLDRHEIFESRFVASREIEVWLPPGYEKGGRTRYPVIYLQDGQYNCLPADNLLGWGLCETVARLIREEVIPPVILVNIWNTSERWREYVPCKPVDRFATDTEKARIRRRGNRHLSDLYLRCLTEELVPFVEASYPVQADAGGRFLMGSSLGAVISLYALCEYPDLFSGAGCLSTHWPLSGGVLLPYMQEALPDPQTHRLYFDISTECLDRQYAEYHPRVARILTEKGYRENQSCMSRIWPGHDHSASSWGQRVHVPLTFLLKPVSP
ncbi:alpha/beta hydrolase-fold protein [Desulfoluna sp.]|uniref:alpha/beta hydrolase n=1 Tax=Desulfoluna sp. TaxID=2045199 RepID=UPI002614F267|nr:alpha/beta hydrolase-fold protein [Desulfoluna sp.]